MYRYYRDTKYNPNFKEKYKGYTITQLVNPANGEFDGWRVTLCGMEIQDYGETFTLNDVKYEIDHFESTDEEKGVYLVISTNGQGYAPDQVSDMTVGELKEILNKYDNDQKIVISAGGRYGAKYWGIGDIEEDE